MTMKSCFGIIQLYLTNIMDQFGELNEEDAVD